MFNFNWEFYINKYPDLVNFHIINEKMALKHWIECGKKEERIYCDIPIYFNWKTYIKQNRDLFSSGIHNEDNAWKHYIYHGFEEGRYSSIEKFMKVYKI
uniref:Uncharacterized protein n=1 Tax=viral metagenome TaxID=1070528 RepID=A0A6C0BAK1_9ZZZZ